MAEHDRIAAKRARTWIERLELVRARGLEPVLIEIAARYFVSPRHVVDGRRHKNSVLARHDFCRTLYGEPYKLSSPEIGELLGLDHTTVLSACGRLGRDKRSA